MTNLHLNWNLVKMLGMVFMLILELVLSDKMVIASEPDQIPKENYKIAFLLFLIEAIVCVFIFTIE